MAHLSKARRKVHWKNCEMRKYAASISKSCLLLSSKHKRQQLRQAMCWFEKRDSRVHRFECGKSNSTLLIMFWPPKWGQVEGKFWHRCRAHLHWRNVDISHRSTYHGEKRDFRIAQIDGCTEIIGKCIDFELFVVSSFASGKSKYFAIYVINPSN